ncbi:MAG: hypothetical protein KDD62_16180, partial [Bdellovibrionales bacterium]|nr:hypothetical protein [Bdellovibrionales bacterium]
VPKWIGRNHSDTGHFKPFWYYAGIIFSKDLFVFLDEFVGDFKSQRLYSMGPSEAILGLAILIPVLSVLVRPKSIWTGLRAGKYSFVLFSFVWTCLSFLVYSFVKYKTPWLIINITFPWILCLAAVLTHLCDRVGIFLFRIATTIVVLSSFAGFSWYYNFTLPYGEGNAYSYVHTSAGMLALTKDIEHYKEKSMSSRILVGVSGYWPLPFYLRGYKEFLGYVNTTDFDRYAKEYDILILDKSVRIEREGWARKYYRLTDAQESYTYFRRLEVDSDQVSFELE